MLNNDKTIITFRSIVIFYPNIIISTISIKQYFILYIQTITEESGFMFMFMFQFMTVDDRYAWS